MGSVIASPAHLDEKGGVVFTRYQLGGASLRYLECRGYRLAKPMPKGGGNVTVVHACKQAGSCTDNRKVYPAWS